MNYAKKNKCGDCFHRCFGRCCFDPPRLELTFNVVTCQNEMAWVRPVVDKETPACHNFKEEKT